MEFKDTIKHISFDEKGNITILGSCKAGDFKNGRII